jgi:hypothetical protein
MIGFKIEKCVRLRVEYKDFQNNNKQLCIQNSITTKAAPKPKVLKEIQKVLKRNFQIMPINLDVAPKKPRAANNFYKIDARPEVVAENPGNTHILLTESNN